MKRLLIAPAALALLASCNSREYEECPAARRIGEWGVVNNTHTFGQYDSLFYIVNPIGNINDSTYYNGNYTDSYYHSDPVRIMLRYTLADSVEFSFDRLYITESNPPHMVMMVQAHDDSLHREAVLYLEKDASNDNLYHGMADTLFRTLLSEGRRLDIQATNGASTSEPQGSQNYEFQFYPAGFDKALKMADSLNVLRLRPDSAVTKADSLKNKAAGKERKR